jgi:hypothetical protein
MIERLLPARPEDRAPLLAELDCALVIREQLPEIEMQVTAEYEAIHWPSGAAQRRLAELPTTKENRD